MIFIAVMIHVPRSSDRYSYIFNLFSCYHFHINYLVVVVSWIVQNKKIRQCDVSLLIVIVIAVKQTDGLLGEDLGRGTRF